MQNRMDWRGVTFDWNRTRAFLVTAEEGSLSAAARALGMAQPTLGRQVSALEEELGVALFERSARGLALTPAGLDLLEHARAMGTAAGRLSLAAAGRSQEVEGLVTITASDIYSAWLLPPILARLHARHPAIEIEIVATNSLRDLRRREADIAIRNTRPTDPELVGRWLRDDSARLYAAESYLNSLPRLPLPDRLNSARFVGFDTGPLLIDGLNARGLSLTPRNFAFLSQTHIVQWELVRQGLGIGVFPTALGEETPGIACAWEEMEPITFPIWLIAHRDLLTSRRIRTVFDFLAEGIAAA